MASLATGITTHQLFLEALTSMQPIWELRGIVRGLLADGHERGALLADLETLQIELRTTGRDGDEDVVLDVMDFLVGWSSPHMRL